MTGSPACTRCGSTSALAIELTAGKNGPQVRMTSCPRCEHRTWTGGGGTVARPQLLELLSGKPDFALQESAAGVRRRR